MSGALKLGRREFIATSVAIASTVPVATFASVLSIESTGKNGETLSNWSIDDMFGVHTRYAEAIAYGHTLDPLDLAPDPLEALLSA